jgi:hypothetical protein
VSNEVHQAVPPALTDADLISNRALQEDDKDDFGYSAISGRVAETILALEPPLTIGLFGPWGSGKSSLCELLRRDLAEKDRKARLVFYDASTYGGEALKRNFISHIAAELGYGSKGHPEFHRGLYESKRRTEVDFLAVKESLVPAIWVFAVVAVAFLLASCLLAGLASLGTDRNFLGQIGHTLPQLIAPAAIGGLIVTVANILLKGATIDAEQSRPASDEAFAKCFRDLVDSGRRDSKFDRLVVFVDELDRCSSEDVVTTLTAIRTFLNQKHAVFVVAADRAALERALDEKLPQPTPIDEENPYYSSASSFFDKVFHDRVPLPPLRGPRLYEWAFDKVRDRDGYWDGLRDGADARALRQVLFFLIPSHVRAPRRVKVLLNSFVRSLAIAAHGGFEWKARAKEIAKLTALDIEFPLLGADLRIEPRLPELLLDPPDDPSERVERLLAKHGGYQIARGPDEESAEEVSEQDAESEPTDTIIAEADQEKRQVLAHAEHEQLRRYLARTRDVRIGRDLLFLDRAGAAVGLEDVELEELLDEAVDIPSNVVQALEDRDEETKQLAAKVLASMADQEFGEERVNVMTALMGVVEQLGAVDEIADEIAGSVASYARDETLDQEHLVGALSLAVFATGYSELEGEILRDDRLLTDPGVLVKTTALLPRVSASKRGPIYEGVATTVASGGEPLLQSLRELPGRAASELFDSGPIKSAVTRYLGQEVEEAGQHDQFIEDIYGIAVGKGDDGAALQRAAHDLLLREEIAYEPFQRHAQQVLADKDVEARDLDVLHAVIRFGNRDLDFWIDQLSDGGYSSPEHGSCAVRVVTECINRVSPSEAEAIDETLAVIGVLSPFVVMADADKQSEVRDALNTQLEASAWWGEEAARERQEGLHRIGYALSEISEDLDSEIRKILAADLQRAPLDPGSLTEQTVRGLVSMGGKLGQPAEAVLELLPAGGEEGIALPVWTTRARVALALSARHAGGEIDATVVTDEAIIEAASQDSAHGREAVIDWLRLGPGAASVASILEALGGQSDPELMKSFEVWCEGTSEIERTSVAKTLLASEKTESRWLDPLVQAGLDELAVVEYIADTVRSAARGDQRNDLMATLARIRPVSAGAQKAVADLIIELVETEKQVDFKAATKAIPALGTEHRSARRLRDAFQVAAEKHGYQLSERTATQLAEASVKVPKKAVKKGAWGRVRDLFR